MPREPHLIRVPALQTLSHSHEDGDTTFHLRRAPHRHTTAQIGSSSWHGSRYQHQHVPDPGLATTPRDQTGHLDCRRISPSGNDDIYLDPARYADCSDRPLNVLLGRDSRAPTSHSEDLPHSHGRLCTDESEAPYQD